MDALKTCESKAQLMRVEEVSEYLGISKATVRRLCREGELKSFKIGSRFYVPAAVFENYVERCM